MMAGVPEPASRPLTPKRTPGLRPAYALAGLVCGALVGEILSFAFGVMTGHLHAVPIIVPIGAVIGAARGSAVSVRVVGDQLKITNPLRRYRITAEQVSKLVSVPGSRLGFGPSLGLLMTQGYAELPIRALRFTRPGRAIAQGSARAGAFADVARWARQHQIPLRASAESWNALLRDQADASAQ